MTNPRIIECAKAPHHWVSRFQENGRTVSWLVYRTNENGTVSTIAELINEDAANERAKIENIRAVILKWLEQAPSPTQIAFGDVAFARAMKGEASVNAFVTEVYVSMCRGAAKEISS